MHRFDYMPNRKLKQTCSFEDKNPQPSASNPLPFPFHTHGILFKKCMENLIVKHYAMYCLFICFWLINLCI